MAIDTFGLACAFGSVAFFGTNYLPVKKYDVGDGFFFQWCLCLGIWLVGVFIDLAHPYSSAPPPFQPLAMLGGAIWCTGQLAVIPIVQTIGIAKGLIIWGSTAMLAGWACGVWGLLGVSSQAEAVHSWALNLSGLALCLASLGVSLLIRPSVGDERPAAKVAPMLEEQLLPAADGAAALPAWLRALDASQRPAVGVGLALGAGFFFGTNFNPSQYILDRAGSGAWRGASTHGLDYVHAQFSGIALASTLYFALYCACTGNRPLVLPRVALPALASGVMWGGPRPPLEPARRAAARRAAARAAAVSPPSRASPQWPTRCGSWPTRSSASSWPSPSSSQARASSPRSGASSCSASCVAPATCCSPPSWPSSSWPAPPASASAGYEVFGLWLRCSV